MTLPRCDHRVPVVDVCSEVIARRPVLYRPVRGSALDIGARVRDDGKRSVDDLYLWGIGHEIVHRGEVIGVIPVDLDDPTTWAAFVADPPGERFSVLLQPFDVMNCGCVKNLGGWYTRRCLMHPAPEGKPCDHGRAPDEGCGQCVIEAAQKVREDRRAIDEVTW